MEKRYMIFLGSIPSSTKCSMKGWHVVSSSRWMPFCRIYRNGFVGMKGSVVDVGGGTGVAISEIVKVYPHLKGINFDLPHVISTAPSYDGVTHVSGDMFKGIPPAETIFIKWILHNWSNDDCVKILKNCRKAIPKDTGKVIIVEIVQRPGQHDPLNDARVTYDLVT